MPTKPCARSPTSSGHSIDADECEIFLHGIDGRVMRVAHAGRSGGQTTVETQPGSLVEWILEHGTSAVELTDGTVRVAHERPPSEALIADQRLWEAQHETAAAVRAVTRADESHRLCGDFASCRPRGTDVSAPTRPRPFARLRFHYTCASTPSACCVSPTRRSWCCRPSKARLLVALAYYAALGAERARLVATAERAEAERRLESLRSALLTAVSHDLAHAAHDDQRDRGRDPTSADDDRAAVIEARSRPHGWSRERPAGSVAYSRRRRPSGAST